MSQPHLSRLRPLPPASVRVDGLDVALVGAVDTAILRGGSSVVTEGTAISLVTNADNGSVFTIRERGVYMALLWANHDEPPARTAVGVSLNTDAAGLTADPTTAVVGMLDAYDQSLAVGSSARASLHSCLSFRVRPQEIAAGIATGGEGALLRFHGTDGVGGAPGITSGIQFTRMRVLRVADLA